VTPRKTAIIIDATIAFLAPQGAGYITGQNIRVDGDPTRSV
jgi:NAD(P)-dependent dehydrogenase (short-subunit alcohol dehydrogenase family)